MAEVRPDFRFFDKDAHMYIQQYSAYMRTRGSTSMRTRNLVKDAAMRLDEFIHAMDLSRGLLSATYEDVIQWKQYMEVGLSESTVSVRVRMMYQFFKWLVSTGKLGTNPVPEPRKLIFLGTEKKDPLILEPKQIFAVRRSRCKSLRSAMAFEFLLATGFRLGEFCQIRACDVVFNKTPYDHELQMPSPYFAAAITYNPKLHNCKTGLVRTNYLGTLAARLLRTYLRVSQIPENSPLPIYCYSESRLYDDIKPWVDEVLIQSYRERGMEVGKVKEERIITRSKGYQDIDLSQYQISDRMARAIANKAKIESMLPQECRKDMTRKVYARLFSPHCMRHTFATIMHYRHYTGIREDINKVMLSLGHAAVSTTYQYLTYTQPIANDPMWQRLITGTTTDWSNI